MKAFKRPDLLSELDDRRGLSEIKPERSMCHDQVLVHQKADQLTISIGESEDTAGFIGDSKSNFGVIFDEPFS